MLERIQKFLSQEGVASRRKSEEFIISGQVFVNGKKARLGDKIDPEKDEVKVYGKIIKPKHKNIYIAINKPRGYIVSKKDPLGRRSVFSLLPEKYRNSLWNVGRLDFDTEGLIVFTNDGSLTQELSHPRYDHEKEYEVTTQEVIKDTQVEKLKKGVKLSEEFTSSPAKIKQKSGKIYITIHEGKNRQIRKMFEKVGLTVLRLKRVRINKYILPNDLLEGEFVYIKKDEIL